MLDLNFNGLTKLREWWPKVKANFQYLDDRIDTIITTPIDGEAAAQELVDARKGKATLGEKIDEMDVTVAAHLADYVTDANGAHGLQVEYGIFTPVIAGSNVAGNNIYEWRSGEYYKIGRLVRFKLGFKLSAKDDAMNGHIQIGGLPFVCSQGSGISADVVTIHQERLSNTGIGLSGYIQTNTSAIYLYFLVDNGSKVQVLPTNINNTTEIRVSGTYLTN